MKEIKYFCDICGKEFDKSNIPPWAPDYCPKHMIEYEKNKNNLSTYTWKDDPKNPIKVWY
jgi:hypothetical protein